MSRSLASRWAREIKFRGAITQDYVETSCTYGRIKYAIFEQAWTILLLGQQGDEIKHYDQGRIVQAIAAYDRLWAEWWQLKAEHPSCATLSKEVSFQGRAGISAAVDRQRARFLK